MSPREPHDLSIEELERLLSAKRQAARRDRIRRFGRSGRAVFTEPPAPPAGPPSVPEKSAPPAARKNLLDRLLLGVEIGAVIVLGLVVLQFVFRLQDLNRDSLARILSETPSATPLITAVVLPSGHTPPDSPGGPAVNEEEIPADLRPQMQSYLSLAIPTRGPEQPLRLDLPSIGKTNMPVVQGDGWEQLKQGVGHHIGSANPGTTGNVVLSAHNDIFGELFRDLDRLQPGDEAVVYTATQKFAYRVVAIRIVEPTDVSVLAPTGRPTLTLISCYPYMVDTQRIVVTAELASY
ncbi:MAG: class D sortase [Anaerolineales bacterium]|nr:class D sortase [Anaerolineales bacterium]